MTAWCKPVENRGEPGYYTVYGTGHAGPDAAIEELRRHFAKDEDVNDLNFVLFSTSGVHGSYVTIEDIEQSMARYPDGPPPGDHPDDYVIPEITFLIVRPRIVTLTYGNATLRNLDDIQWAKRVRWLSAAAVAKIGAP